MFRHTSSCIYPQSMWSRGCLEMELVVFAKSKHTSHVGEHRLPSSSPWSHAKITNCYFFHPKVVKEDAISLGGL